MDIEKIQNLLRNENIDAWLFTDFQGHDFVSREFLKLGERKSTRYLFYLVPAEGEPVKILSVIEPLLLDHLPGQKVLYNGRRGRDKVLQQYLRPGMRVACQYAAGGNVPTISSMDAGLKEYLEQFPIELESSADLIQYCAAVLSEEQIETHRQAGIIIHRILDRSFEWIRDNLDAGNEINEWMFLQELKKNIVAEEIYMDSPPFFGVDEHACDPGYEPQETESFPIKEGSRLLIDIAGRLPQENAVYYDVSWSINIGENKDPEYERLFQIVHNVRMQAVDMIAQHLRDNKEIRGCDVDAFVQKRLTEQGLGACLKHRTGHNIGHNCHGPGANLDDYETRDVRRLIPGTMFSIEPGVYTETHGVRLEFDVHITPEKQVKIYGPIQNQIKIV